MANNVPLSEQNIAKLAAIGYEKWRLSTEQIWPTWEKLDEYRQQHWCGIAQAILYDILLDMDWALKGFTFTEEQVESERRPYESHEEYFVRVNGARTP